MYNRLNLWSRPFLINPSHPLTPQQGHLDSGSSYLPVSMQPNPAALMVLASSSSNSSSNSSAVPEEALVVSRDGPLSSSMHGRPSAGRSISPPETRDVMEGVRHPRHPAFGAGPFPFFRPGEALQVPPFFSHLHQTLLRSHLDSAAAHLHQAVMDPRRVASLYGLHSHPSAFLATAPTPSSAAAKKVKYDGGFSLDDRIRSSPPPGSTTTTATNRQSSRAGHDLSTGAQSSSSLRGAPWTPSSSCSPPLADERRSSSAGGLSDADYDVISDHHGDAATSASSPVIGKNLYSFYFIDYFVKQSTFQSIVKGWL